MTRVLKYKFTDNVEFHVESKTAIRIPVGLTVHEIEPSKVIHGTIGIDRYNHHEMDRPPQIYTGGGGTQGLPP